MKSIINKKKKMRMRNFTLCKTNPVWGLNVKEVWIILVAKFNGIKHAARIKCKKLCDENRLIRYTSVILVIRVPTENDMVY